MTRNNMRNHKLIFQLFYIYKPEASHVSQNEDKIGTFPSNRAV